MNQGLLDRLLAECRPYTAKGRTASYIPMLQEADEDRLGICVADLKGDIYTAGDCDDPFTMQSISKIITFTCALLDSGIDRVFEIVSVEPTDDAFNSISNLEVKNNHRPLNPMINAGSIACITLVGGFSPLEKHMRILQFIRELAGNPSIMVDEEVYLSEKRTGSRNRALAYYMQSTGLIEGDIEELLDAYFRTCSIRLNCEDLARIALVYACDGNRLSGESLFSKQIARIVKATMTMCGMYDESGYVAVNIGLPTKSGVGGGILSVVPQKAGIGVYGPALNPRGSSAAGLALLERLCLAMDWSIF